METRDCATQLETQQESYGDDCEYDDDDYQEQDYAIGRKDKITWTTSLTIPDEFEKRDDFIFAIQDFLNFGYSANEFYNINLPRCSHFWRDIYMFYYKNIDQVKYAREVFFLAIGFHRFNMNVIAAKLLARAVKMGNPMSMTDVSRSLGCGMLELPECKPDIFCNCIATVLLEYLYDWLFIKGPVEKTLALLTSLDEDGLIDYFCRAFFSSNLQRCKWDLENIYRKKLRKHFAGVISNLNLYSQDLIPIITHKSGKSSNEYIQFALFLTEMTWIYTNQEYYQCGLFTDLPYVVPKVSFGYKTYPDHTPVNLDDYPELGPKVMQVIDKVVSYLSVATDEEITKNYNGLTRKFAYFSFASYALDQHRCKEKNSEFPLFDCDKFNQKLEKFRAKPIPEDDPYGPEYYKYIRNSLDYYDEMFSAVYTEIPISKQYISSKKCMDNYSIIVPVDENCIHFYCTPNHVICCSKGKAYCKGGSIF